MKQQARVARLTVTAQQGVAVGELSGSADGQPAGKAPPRASARVIRERAHEEEL
jgi:hypothetical protein